MSMKPTLSSQNSKPRTPNSPVSPTVRQLLQAERLSNYLSNNNIDNNVLSPKLGKDSQQDDDRFNFNFQPAKKISMLAKVKEKARKWKQSIGKKKPGQDTDPSSSWGAAYEDYDKDETPRRLGTTPSKLYGLRRSSSSYREGGGLSRQRSLSGLSISEKHVLSCSVDRGYNEQCERIPQKESNHSPIKRLPSLRDDGKRLTPIKTKPNEPKIEEYHDDPVEDVEKDKPPPSYEEVMQDSKEKHMTPQKSNIEEAKVESLDSIKTIERIQEAITIEEAKELNQICLKIIHSEKGKRPTPSPEEGAFQEEKKREIDSPTTKGKSLAEAVTEKLTPTTSTSNSEEQGFELPKPLRVNTTRIEAPVCVVDESDDDDNLEENGIAGECKWDKGVSVKEYIKNKLEPGEDERALSQVISEAISPRRTPGDKGVMEKVKEAVTLLLLAEQRQVERQEEKHKQHHHQQQQQQQHYQQQHYQQQHYQQQQRSSSQSMRHSSSSMQIPVSTNAYEDELNVEEENHGRILQAN